MKKINSKEEYISNNFDFLAKLIDRNKLISELSYYVSLELKLYKCSKLNNDEMYYQGLTLRPNYSLNGH